MKRNLRNMNCIAPRKSASLAWVNRDDVQARARELALLEGRTPPNVAQADYEQAKRELTGESDPVRQEAMLNAPQHAGNKLADSIETPVNRSKHIRVLG